MTVITLDARTARLKRGLRKHFKETTHGTYWVRITAGRESAVARVVVVR
jgi:hypothetical protein